MDAEFLTFLFHVGLSTIPVLAFLGALLVVDSYKLVRPQSVAAALLAGAVATALSFGANIVLLDLTALELRAFSRYIAPLVEEVAKGLFVVHVIRHARVGFVVDAAIIGFAVGAGFAAIENLYYLHTIEATSALTWMVRGFGTAVMHGGTASIFAMVSKAIFDRREYAGRGVATAYVPGLLLAAGLHSLFNHFLLPPLTSTLLILLVLPTCMAVVFQQSERATRSWLGAGFDSDQELLQLILSGKVADTRVGHYLRELRTRFPGTIVADMLCLLRLHVELSIRAKGVLMMRENGFRVPPDPSLQAKFDELAYLEKTINRTGMLAMAPFLHMSTRDLWQRNHLSETSSRPSPTLTAAKRMLRFRAVADRKDA